MTRQQGRLAEWNDERGFGFITPDAGGPRVFVHVSAFPRGRRPTGSDEVTFTVRTDERHRLAASDLQYVGSRRTYRSSRKVPPAAMAVALFAAVLVVLVLAKRAPVLLLVPYAVLSVAAIAMYRADKRAAIRGGWRTPEAHLHTVALLGGWPGALIARQVYRHKTTKQPFRLVFWMTVAANCAALAWLVYADPTWLPGS